jgi:hypothetical protein
MAPCPPKTIQRDWYWVAEWPIQGAGQSSAYEVGKRSPSQMDKAEQGRKRHQSEHLASLKKKGKELTSVKWILQMLLCSAPLEVRPAKT